MNNNAIRNFTQMTTSSSRVFWESRKRLIFFDKSCQKECCGVTSASRKAKSMVIA